MLAYDWMYEMFSPEERALIAHLATNWIDWYSGATNNDGLGYYYANEDGNRSRIGWPCHNPQSPMAPPLA